MGLLYGMLLSTKGIKMINQIIDAMEFGATINEISEQTGIRYDDVKAVIDKMKSERTVRIVDWERTSDKITYDAVYSVGSGRDATLKLPGAVKRDYTVKMLFGDSVVE
jgi:transcription initiation factor IIE alpha subunit